ncbi:hypothetical protein ABH927_005716 [Planotetraspora sp. GP83]
MTDEGLEQTLREELRKIDVLLPDSQIKDGQDGQGSR